MAAARPGAHVVPVRGRERALAGPSGHRRGGSPHPAPRDGCRRRHGTHVAVAVTSVDTDAMPVPTPPPPFLDRGMVADPEGLVARTLNEMR